MNRRLLKDGVFWGFLLWLIGYLLGFVFFMFVPQSLIGWVIMPLGIAVTIWVLIKKIKGTSTKYYLKIAIIWTLLAIVLDYFLLVKLLKPRDGYYKLDVYLYYISVFVLPLIVGWQKNSRSHHNIDPT